MEITYEYDYLRFCYVVFVNGRIYCTCDVGELSETEREIREEYENA